MKFIPTTVILRDTGHIEFETLLSDTNGPQYQQVKDRGDLPNAIFHTTKGTVWLSARDIVAIIFADTPDPTQH